MEMGIERLPHCAAGGIKVVKFVWHSIEPFVSSRFEVGPQPPSHPSIPPGSQPSPVQRQRRCFARLVDEPCTKHQKGKDRKNNAKNTVAQEILDAAALGRLLLVGTKVQK